MMAAARAEKQGGAAKPAPKPATAEKPAAAKPAAKPAAAKVEAKPAAAAISSNGPKDTGSILAAARATTKPGPMTKAEAARWRPKRKRRPSREKPNVVVPPMPPKPDYAKPKAPAEAAEGRRGFLIGVLFGSLFGLA